jgi:hypothetical protein
METKQAYGIEELAKAGPLRRSYLFRAIKEKRLIAQKAGRRTFVTHENWQAFLRSFPVVGEEGNIVRPHDRQGADAARHPGQHHQPGSDHHPNR